MLKKNKPLDKFADLTWNDLEDWAGSKIVSRGRSYQRQGWVSGIGFTDDGALLAWVNGSQLYATRVAMDADGLLESICTCPYGHDCKHGVAMVVEFLEQIENNRRVPKVKKGDQRLAMLEDEDRDYESDDDEPILAAAVTTQIDAFLEDKTKAQLIKLIRGLAEKYPEWQRTWSTDSNYFRAILYLWLRAYAAKYGMSAVSLTRSTAGGARATLRTTSAFGPSWKHCSQLDTPTRCLPLGRS